MNEGSFWWHVNILAYESFWNVNIFLIKCLWALVQASVHNVNFWGRFSACSGQINTLKTRIETPVKETCTSIGKASWPIRFLDRTWFLIFAVEHWFGCRATEPGITGDIGAIEVWLIDWLNMVCTYVTTLSDWSTRFLYGSQPSGREEFQRECQSCRLWQTGINHLTPKCTVDPLNDGTQILVALKINDLLHDQYLVRISLRTFRGVLIYPSTNPEATSVALFTIRVVQRVSTFVQFNLFVKNNGYLQLERECKLNASTFYVYARWRVWWAFKFYWQILCQPVEAVSLLRSLVNLMSSFSKNEIPSSVQDEAR